MSRLAGFVAALNRAACAMRGHVDLPAREGDRLAWQCSDCGRVAPTGVPLIGDAIDASPVTLAPVLPFAPEEVRDWQ